MKMKYELTKKLKDADFPINWEISCGHCGYDNGANGPTLSELIEACGDKFGELKKSFRYGDNGYIEVWDAREEYDNTSNYGSTPEEAVVNLWLKLNAK